MEFLFEGRALCPVALAVEQTRHASFQGQGEVAQRRLEARAVAGHEAQRARPVRFGEIEHIGDVRRRRHGGSQPLQRPANRVALARALRPGDEQIEPRLGHARAQMQGPHGTVLSDRADRLGQAGRALEGQPVRIGDQPQPARLQRPDAHPNSPQAGAPHLFGTVRLVVTGTKQGSRRRAGLVKPSAFDSTGHRDGQGQTPRLAAHAERPPPGPAGPISRGR